MIPQRLQDSETGGNGLKGRVTACRKRLRVHRVPKRVELAEDAEQLSPKPGRVADEAVNSEHWPTAGGSVVKLDHGLPNASAEAGETETLQLAGQQEVGIT